MEREGLHALGGCTRRKVTNVPIVLFLDGGMKLQERLDCVCGEERTATIKCGARSGPR